MATIILWDDGLTFNYLFLSISTDLIWQVIDSTTRIAIKLKS